MAKPTVYVTYGTKNAIFAALIESIELEVLSAGDVPEIAATLASHAVYRLLVFDSG